MDDLKLWTVEAANAALPNVRDIVEDIRDGVGAQRFALEQAADLQREHGRRALDDPEHPAHDEHARFVESAEAASARVRRDLRALTALGVELKDPFLGLVDFPTLRGSEVVYLCWRPGEDEVAHWHPLTKGYKDRRELDPLVRAAGR